MQVGKGALVIDRTCWDEMRLKMRECSLLTKERKLAYHRGTKLSFIHTHTHKQTHWKKDVRINSLSLSLSLSLCALPHHGSPHYLLVYSSSIASINPFLLICMSATCLVLYRWLHHPWWDFSGSFVGCFGGQTQTTNSLPVTVCLVNFSCVVYPSLCSCSFARVCVTVWISLSLSLNSFIFSLYFTKETTKAHPLPSLQSLHLKPICYLLRHFYYYYYFLSYSLKHVLA